MAAGHGLGPKGKPQMLWLLQCIGCSSTVVRADRLTARRPSPAACKYGRCWVQVQDGDTICIDAERHVVDAVDVTPEEFGRRLAEWTAPPLKFTQGTLYKYIRDVSSASLGCVTDL